jgi:hypothetical protein
MVVYFQVLSGDALFDEENLSHLRAFIVKDVVLGFVAGGFKFAIDTSEYLNYVCIDS